MKNDMDSHYYLVDEAGDLSPTNNRTASRIFVVGCIVLHDIDSIKISIDNLWKELRKKRKFRRHMNKKNLDRVGFHACEDHSDIRNEFIEFMIQQPFRYYAVFIDKKQTSPSETLYRAMLINLLKGRMTKKNRTRHRIFIEQKMDNPSESRIPEEENILKEALSKEISSTEEMECKLCLKDFQPLALTDYMNFILRHFLEGNKNGFLPYMKNDYEMMRNKIGLIHNYSNNEFFSPRKSQKDIALGKRFC